MLIKNINSTMILFVGLMMIICMLCPIQSIRHYTNFSSMCIVFFYSTSSLNSPYSFVLASNREEMSQRKTLKLAQFDEDQNIYGGKDVDSGGTWIGVNAKTGIAVLLTNFAMLPEKVRKGISRGVLVAHFLKTSFIPQDKIADADSLIFKEVNMIASKIQDYSPFNLVVTNLHTGSMHYLCSEKEELNPLELNRQKAYGLSNSDITTLWQKTSFGLAKFQKILGSSEQLNTKEMLEKLIQMMQDRTKFKEPHHELTSIFIQPYFNQRYQVERKTKSTLVILVSNTQGRKQVTMKEITYGNQKQQQVLLSFAL